MRVAGRARHRHRLEREGGRALPRCDVHAPLRALAAGAARPSSCRRQAVYANLVASAAKHPQRTAIDYYGSRSRMPSSSARSTRSPASCSSAAACARGDRVLLYTQNSPQFIIAYYAILRADAVVVPVNPMNRTEELRHYVEDSDARVAIAGKDVLRELEPLGLPHVLPIVYADYLGDTTDLPVPGFLRDAWVCGVERGAGGEPRARPASRRAGRPRGDALHLGHHRQAEGLHAHARQHPGDHRAVPATGAARRTRAWCSRALPMFHVTGMQAGMNAPIHTAATLVLLSRWDRDCAGDADRARAASPTGRRSPPCWSTSSPTRSSRSTTSPRCACSAAAARRCPRRWRAGWRSARPAVRRGLRPVRDHGADAHQPAAPAQAPVRRHSVLQHRCARRRSRRRSRSWARTRWAKSSSTARRCSSGYWKQPEATAQAFLEHDGKRFFRTGDLGYYDEEGYFFITDRLKRMINCSGFKVWPAEVEAMLYAHPGDPGGLRHRRARRATAARRSRRWWC